MQIAKHQHGTLPIAFEDKLPELIDLWRELFVGAMPDPVEIDPSQVSPIVSMDDTIRVQHGDESKDKLFPEFARHGGATGQEIHDAFHDKGRDRLSRVDPTGHKDRVLLLPGDFVVGDSDQRHHVFR